MIVQTQAAQRLLVEKPGDADAAMAIIEDTGRQALAAAAPGAAVACSL